MPITTSLAGRAGTGLAVLALTLAGCGHHYLAEYDFAGRSIAMVSYGTPVPELWTGDLDIDASNPLEAVVSAGGRVAREVEARAARARLDSAAHRVQMERRLADRTLERAATYLGARPAPRDEADFLLEVNLEAIGLDASREYPHLLVRGEAVLLDALTGREIWSQKIDGHDPLAPGIHQAGAVGDVVTAAMLRAMTVEDFERVLEQLADYAADRITRELRADLRDVRRG